MSIVKRIVGFLIISMTLLIYALIIVLMQFVNLIAEPYYVNIFYRIPLLVHFLCISSLGMGVYLVREKSED